MLGWIELSPELRKIRFKKNLQKKSNENKEKRSWWRRLLDFSTSSFGQSRFFRMLPPTCAFKL